MLRKEGKNRIPDRWLEYTARGVKIQGTRFIAFKVPLSEAFDKVLKKDNRFNLDDLVAEVPRLGIVIDLTNTTRYYDGVDFETQGIMYKKVSIPGHATPPKNLVKRFAAIVTDFLDDNFKNDKLIGVHCTHGVNRTGYMICNYMITHMNFTPQKAMKRFNDARGHEIERENYIESLMCLPELIEKEKQEPWRGQIYSTRSENTPKSKNDQRNGHEQKKSRRNGFVESCLLGSDVYGSNRRRGRKTNSKDSRYDRDDGTNSRDRYRNRDQQPSHERVRNYEKEYHSARDDRYNQRYHRDDNRSKRDNHYANDHNLNYERSNGYHTARPHTNYSSNNYIRNSYHDKPSTSRRARDRTEPYNTNWRQRPRDTSDERYDSRHHLRFHN